MIPSSSINLNTFSEQNPSITFTTTSKIEYTIGGLKHSHAPNENKYDSDFRSIAVRVCMIIGEIPIIETDAIKMCKILQDEMEHSAHLTPIAFFVPTANPF